MRRQTKLLLVAAAALALVGLLALVRLTEWRVRVDPSITGSTLPPETTAPQPTIPDFSYPATPWG
jgi:hypothetical protein